MLSFFDVLLVLHIGIDTWNSNQEEEWTLRISRLACLAVRGFMAGSASEIVIRSKLQNYLFEGMSSVEYFYEESVCNMYD